MIEIFLNIPKELQILVLFSLISCAWFILKGNKSNILHALEPWCSTIYTDIDLLQNYIQEEQKHTIINLHEKVKPYDNEKQNQILVEIDSDKFTEQDYQIIQQLPDILDDSGEIGEFELGNLYIHILELDTFEKDIIK